jgi:uncharacterized protein YjbJ (UPF0337 family)
MKIAEPHWSLPCVYEGSRYKVVGIDPLERINGNAPSAARRPSRGFRVSSAGRGSTVSAQDKVKNTAETAKGKVKEGIGKATDDKSLEAEGHADQAKGDLKQAGEKIKDAFKK